MLIFSYVAVVIDTDGSAFITKAEFDSLKNNFQAQIDSYNSSIDSKIDGAIAAYLSGIRTSIDSVVEYGQCNLGGYLPTKCNKTAMGYQYIDQSYALGLPLLNMYSLHGAKENVHQRPDGASAVWPRDYSMMGNTASTLGLDTYLVAATSSEQPTTWYEGTVSVDKGDGTSNYKNAYAIQAYFSNWFKGKSLQLDTSADVGGKMVFTNDDFTTTPVITYDMNFVGTGTYKFNDIRKMTPVVHYVAGTPPSYTMTITTSRDTILNPTGGFGNRQEILKLNIQAFANIDDKVYDGENAGTLYKDVRITFPKLPAYRATKSWDGEIIGEDFADWEGLDYNYFDEPQWLMIKNARATIKYGIPGNKTDMLGNHNEQFYMNLLWYNYIKDGSKKRPIKLLTTTDSNGRAIHYYEYTLLKALTGGQESINQNTDYTWVTLETEYCDGETYFSLSSPYAASMSGTNLYIKSRNQQAIHRNVIKVIIEIYDKEDQLLQTINYAN